MLIFVCLFDSILEMFLEFSVLMDTRSPCWTAYLKTAALPF